jgi:hypothetical protein
LSRQLICAAVLWQLVVISLVVLGIMGDIYNLLHIPWNASGVLNVIGTTLGWLICESPLIALLVLQRYIRRDGK